MAIEKKELGKTGVMVPEIGQGTWRYRGGVEPLQKGIELGATLIDTAEMYRTEDVVGQALKDQRERVFLASKVLPSHLHYDDVLKAADASLRLLKVDHMDLYQVHWPNSSVPIKETMAAMATLVDRGLVKFIGVSNFSTRQLQEAQGALSNLPIVSNQVLYNLKNRRIERDLLPYCQKNGVTIIAYTPLADGSLATGPKIGRDKRIQALQSVADQAAKTMAQVALNWCTSHEDVIAIPKTNSVSRTMENCGASGWRLTPEQIDVLDQAFAAG
jgi:diketogulonate reductase-like aldo/keto reductase